MSPRSRIVPWLSMVCVVFAIASLTAATRPPEPVATDDVSVPSANPPATTAPGGPEPIPATAAPARESFLTSDLAVSPMLEAIRVAWQEHTVQRAKLETELAATPDASASLAVQRRLEAAMHGLELRILSIQVDFARREGREEVAERLETAIERMVSPPTLPSPPERPAPAGSR